jgi:hypothetical protein
MEGHENVDICITGGPRLLVEQRWVMKKELLGREERGLVRVRRSKGKARQGQVKSSHAFTPPPISHHQQRGCKGSCIPGATAAPNSSSKDLLLVTVAYPAGGSDPDRLKKRRRWGENCAGLGITCADISPLQPLLAAAP